MIEVRLVEDGPRRYSAGGTVFEPGEVRDVSEDLAEHLLDKPFFESAEGGEAADAGGEDESAEFDVDAWLEQDYEERAERVAAGDVDDHLDTVADAETSDNVRDAIGERRAEIEG